MWYEKFLNTYKAGISHEFLFYFNIRDYVDDLRTMDRYLFDEFIKSRNFGIVAFYDISRGLTFLEPAMEREFHKITANEMEGLLRSVPSKLFGHIDKAMKNTKMFLFFDHLEKLIPAGDIGSLSFEERISLIWLSEWSIHSKISAVGSVLALMSDDLSGVNRELLRSSYKVETFLVDLPKEEERKKYLKYLLKDGQVKMDITLDDFAKLSSGLSKKSIKDIKLKAEAENVAISFQFIKEKKHSLLQKEYGDVLEFIYPELGFEDIGGMDIIKNYLTNNVVEPIKKGDLKRVPMGILLCGPSGTGKTLLVYALAKASGFNCVKIDMSRILGQFVGESEKNFKRCLLGAGSQEPVIVFVDEIDTAFRRGDVGDSGVGRNIFSEFLQFTGNHSNRGRIIFIAATNRPDLLDAALKRAGRFDKKIPILLPGERERSEIFKIKLGKMGMKPEFVDFGEIENATKGYTGAEIELVVRKAYQIICEKGGSAEQVTEEQILDACKRCMPGTHDVEMMTKLAIEECDDMDLIPAEYKKESVKS